MDPVVVKSIQTFRLMIILAVLVMALEGAGKPKPPAPRKIPSACDVSQWPQLLPAANRTQSKNIQITFYETETAPTLSSEAAVIPKSINSDQYCLLTALKENRSNVNSSMLKLQRYRTFIGGKRILNYGYFYEGKTLKEPSVIQTINSNSERKLLVKKAVWEELKHEGNTSSINAYDSQLLTWGRGFGARVGLLPPVLDRLFADTTVANIFLQYGIKWKQGFQVVNLETGSIESGLSALRLIQADPKLLGVFVLVAEDPRLAQKVADAQWAVVEKNAGAVPMYAHQWDDRWIQLVSHLSHWWPATGWKGANFASSRGISEILITWGRQAAKQKNPYIVTNADTILNLKRWGSGVGWDAIKGVSGTPMPYTKEQITNPENTQFKDVVCILAQGGASYYFFPKLPTLTNKGIILKGNVSVEDRFYIILNDLSMAEKLESLLGLEEIELKEKNAAYDSQYLQRYGGRLRIALKASLLALPETHAALSDLEKITADPDFRALERADKKAVTDFMERNLK